MVGLNIRVAAVRSRVSQRHMGRELGLSSASICARLSGRTPIDINELVRIAALLDVPLATLLDGVEVPEPIGATA